jgi:maltose O-acetyltransferase
LEPNIEKAKMIAGELYLSADPGLEAERFNARRLTRLYNVTTDEEPERRRAILEELLGAIGARGMIEPPFHCDYGSLIRLGDSFYANFGCVILDCNHVTIGHEVKFGPGVHIYAATHPLDPVVRSSGVELGFPVTIGNRVWVGGGSKIGPGVTIGENSVIGAGSVVVKSIPPNVVAAGVPCRVIRPIP